MVVLNQSALVIDERPFRGGYAMSVDGFASAKSLAREKFLRND
jgi:hypothetical protein